MDQRLPERTAIAIETVSERYSTQGAPGTKPGVGVVRQSVSTFSQTAACIPVALRVVATSWLGILAATAYVPNVADAEDSSARFEIVPPRALLDEKVRVELTGLTPGQQVEVRARQVGSSGEVYQSLDHFQADRHGTVDLSSPPPGATAQAPLRLLWSLKPLAGATGVGVEVGELGPWTIEFLAESDGREIAAGRLVQLGIGADVIRTPVRERDLVGTFFCPKGSAKYPGVIVVGGSGGGLSESRAALLASRGYAALALAYFNYESLPTHLVNIPLEYFGKSIQWMQEQQQVDGDHLAVIGTSRGGELALLLGATFSEIKAVVAYAPSHVVWAGNPSYSSWSFEGKSVPCMSKPPDPRLVRELLMSDPAVKKPMFVLQLANAEDVESAAIQVEKIQGPVLLLSGDDDRLWPSTFMAEMVMNRLSQHAHPYRSRHYSYPGCGHVFPLPTMVPPPTRRAHRVTGELVDYGGTLEATAWAAWDSWSKVLQFLAAHLQQGSQDRNG